MGKKDAGAAKKDAGAAKKDAGAAKKDAGAAKKDAGAAKKDAAGGGGGKVKGAQSINVRHVLCAKHSKKEEAATRLRDGARFDDVAREFSEDKARAGGALGWKTKGELLPEFEAVAFALEASSTAKPAWAECKTAEGYHLVMVEGRK